MPDETTSPSEATSKPRWQPIGPIDRRVAGVLVEKAKTTPEAYPLSLNAIVSACNQKSNRHPIMQLEADDAEESLERLRGLGAVAIVQGYGRVSKYRHYMYEWLGVDKVELAVVTELLLRRAQTEGELRGRAARMEPIPDLGALRPVLASLKAKGLVIPLTPEGRGHVLTHGLYPPRELEHLRAQFSQGSTAAAVAQVSESEHEEGGSPTWSGLSETGLESRRESPTGSSGATNIGARMLENDNVAGMRGQLEELRHQVTQLRSDLAGLSAKFEQTSAELQRVVKLVETFRP